MSKVKINPEVIQKHRRYYKNEVNDGFKNTIVSKDYDDVLGTPSLESLVALNSFIECWAVYGSMYETLKDYFSLKDGRLGNKDHVKLNMVSMFAGMLQGYSYINKYIQDEVPAHQISVDYTSPNPFFDAKNLCTSAIRRRAPPNSRDTTLIMKIFYNSVLNDILKRKTEYPDLDARVNAICPIQVNGLELTGLTTQQITENFEFQKIEWSELVGVDDASNLLSKYCSQLFNYDYEKQDNSEKKLIPWTILLYGPPGTGKSSIAMAMATQMQCYSRAYGIPFSFTLIDGNIKSEWFGKSGTLLREKLYDNPNKINLKVIDDMDMIFQSREDLLPSAAQKEISGELMKYISGIGVGYKGNTILLMTTNRKTEKDIDPAVFSRTKKMIKVVGPIKSSDYQKLIQIKTKDSLIRPLIKLSANDYAMVGDYCEQNHYSGRDIDNIISNMSDYIIPGPLPIEWGNLKKEERTQRRINSYRPITGDICLRLLEEYSISRKKEFDGLKM